jgi:signal transduction histidine kinase
VRIQTERDDDGHLVVHIGDIGLGMSEAEQERIFLRFRRGKEATGDGFGLGLAIVRDTAQQFGGRILLESEPGEGSTFSFTIPADQLKE